MWWWYKCVVNGVDVRGCAWRLAGELMVERHIAQWGKAASGWPAAALAALHRRHDWLMAALAARICFVPPALFLPLGLRSRALLFPGERYTAYCCALLTRYGQ